MEYKHIKQPNINIKNNNEDTETVFTEYADKVMSKLELLTSPGKFYRRKIYKINDIKDYYINDLKNKYSNMGEKYITDMIKNIDTIINNVSRYSKYDVLEFIDSMIQYFFKSLAFKFKLTKKEPAIPDYTLPEISDLTKQSIIIIL